MIIRAIAGDEGNNEATMQCDNEETPGDRGSHPDTQDTWVVTERDG